MQMSTNQYADAKPDGEAFVAAAGFVDREYSSMRIF